MALASFGEASADRVFGVHTFITFDLRLIRRFEVHCDNIAAALERMTSQLALSYRDAMLPEVATPQAALVGLVC